MSGNRAWCNDCGDWGDHPTFEHNATPPPSPPTPLPHQWMGEGDPNQPLKAWEEGAICRVCESCGKTTCCKEAPHDLPCPGMDISAMRNFGHTHVMGDWIRAGVLPNGKTEWVRQCVEGRCQLVEAREGSVLGPMATMGH